MSKKRVFDKNLGVELVLDDEIDQDESALNVNRKNQLSDDRGSSADSRVSSNRKRAKFDLGQNSNQRCTSANAITAATSQQQQQSGVSSKIPSSQNSSSGTDLGQVDLPRESDLEGDYTDSENYEDIDYGDDDDEEFNSDSHHKHTQQSEDSKSQDARDDPYGDDDDEHENIEQDCSDDERANLSGVMDDDGDGVHGSKDEEGEKEQAERCKYWPSCNAGDSCLFYHPIKPCRAFPNCRFGKKCLYVHPPCKFNPHCTRPGCPFSHPASLSAKKRLGPGQLITSQKPLVPKCKFGFNCMNVMCKFSHQRSEPCRFGANCLLESCAYTHPSDVPRKKPASAFKWSAQS